MTETSITFQSDGGFIEIRGETVIRHPRPKFDPDGSIPLFDVDDADQSAWAQFKRARNKLAREALKLRGKNKKAKA